MKMMDCVEVIVEKRKYTEDGVHKGMQGWICMEECIDGYSEAKVGESDLSDYTT